MRIPILLAAVLLATAAVAQEPARDVVDTNPHLGPCREAADALGKALKTRLQAALADGGPAAAMTICHDEAPAIAAAVGDSLHLVVGRTALRVRNSDNAPDDWERAALEDFKARRAKGEQIKDMETWIVTRDAEGRRWFRYLKAIPTAPLCLKCHGKDIAPTVAARLAKLYPDDKATGFMPGDLRGAFTVSRPMDD